MGTSNISIVRLVVTVFGISNMPRVAGQALPCGQDTLGSLQALKEGRRNGNFVGRIQGKRPRISHPHGRDWQATRVVFYMPKTITTNLTMETLLVPTRANR